MMRGPVMSVVYIVLNYMFIQNLALTWGLGLVPALGKRQDFRYHPLDFALGGAYMLVAVMLAWVLNWIFVDLLGLTYIRTVLFVLVIVFMMYGTETLLSKMSERIRAAGRLFTAPVNASSAVMGLIVLIADSKFGPGEAFAAAVGGILGFALALGAHGTVLARLELEWLPRSFRGLPIALICLGLISLVFMAVSALIISSLGKAL